MITISGKYNQKYNSFSVSEVLFEPILKPIFVIKYSNLTKNKVTIKQDTFASYITQILDSNYTVKKFISDDIRSKYKLIERRDALNFLHRGDDENDMIQALRYLKFEELYLYFLQIELLIKNVNTRIGFIKDKDLLKPYIKNIGFELTSKQQLCLNDCIEDLQNNVCTKRLIQGDVGSGKTIVAFLTMIYVYLNNKKSVFIAPTSILATQHYAEFVQRFPNLKTLYVDSKSLNIGLMKQINSGDFDVLIGTTSIMSSKLILDNLDIELVIIDEQQRFGVNQRIKLEQKLKSICSLYMSATPIPRTLELANLGYLSTSIIDQYPKSKKEVWTKILNDENKTFGIIEEELYKNNKIYVIVSRIGDKEELHSIETEYDKYRKVFKNAKISLLHSKLTSEEKEQIFKDFNSGLIDILIATTIVEVGVNNKDATVIVINDAHMYGVSQLHQLRGRVGRSHKQSYAFLIYPHMDTLNENTQTLKRLDYVSSTTNGFELANFDLKQRGSGSIISERQSGTNDLKLCNLNNEYDLKIAKFARLEANLTLEKKQKDITNEEKVALDYVTNQDVTHLN